MNKHILLRQNYPNPKVEKDASKKKVIGLWANIPDEFRLKNL
jgi:hypothetical protein